MMSLHKLPVFRLEFHAQHARGLVDNSGRHPFGFKVHRPASPWKPVIPGNKKVSAFKTVYFFIFHSE